MVLSIGVFFTLMVLGLAAGLPGHLDSGLLAAGVPAARASRISHLPPVGTLFAAFLGYNPMGVLLGPSLHHLSAAHAQELTSRSYFPGLIAAPFHAGLEKAFDFAAVACLVAAGASWLSGGKYVHGMAGTCLGGRDGGLGRYCRRGGHDGGSRRRCRPDGQRRNPRRRARRRR